MFRRSSKTHKDKASPVNHNNNNRESLSNKEDKVAKEDPSPGKIGKIGEDKALEVETEEETEEDLIIEAETEEDSIEVEIEEEEEVTEEDSINLIIKEDRVASKRKTGITTEINNDQLNK